MGKGRADYQRAKQLVSNWEQFQLGWAFVDPETPVKPGEGVCMSINTFGVWTINPLEVL